MHQLRTPLRFLALSCEMLGILAALFSIVVLAHWLLYAIDAPGLRLVLAPLSALMAPLNHLAHQAPLHLPPIHYEKQTIGFDQIIVGAGFMVVYFVGIALASLIRSLERRLNAPYRGR